MYKLRRLLRRLALGVRRLWDRLTGESYDEYTIAQLFRSQGARIGDGCRLLVRDLGSEPYLIEIGDETLVSSGVRFVTHDGATWVFRDRVPGTNRFAPIRIGNRCFIGLNSILLPGVVIGDRSIIGAGSVVTGSIPSGVVAAGVPARVIGTVADYQKKVTAESLPLKGCKTPEDKREQLTRLLMDEPD